MEHPLPQPPLRLRRNKPPKAIGNRRYLFLLIAFSHIHCFASGQDDTSDSTLESSSCYPRPAPSAPAPVQSPMLIRMVESNELPPLLDRLPNHPLRLQSTETPGTYCFTLNVIAHNDDAWQTMSSPLRGNFPLRISVDGTITEDVIFSYEFAEEFRTLKLSLREGMRWSDGTPFTTNDFAFKYSIDQHEDYIVSNSWRRVSSRIVELEVYDDLNMKYNFDEPFPTFVSHLASWRGGELVLYAPRHWLEKWHIVYNRDAELLAKEDGYGSNWIQAFSDRYRACCNQKGIGRPTHQGWTLSSYTPGEIRVWSRNPYYHIIDADGKQLPYFDSVRSEVVRDEHHYYSAILAGQVDVAYVSDPAYYRKFMAEYHSVSSPVKVKLIPGVYGSEAAYIFNLSHPEQIRRKIYRDVRFRRAMSLAIDRDEINSEFFSGLATARQATVVPQAPYYDPSWGEDNSWIRFDPVQANELLDELGLVRDPDGKRLFPDGTPVLVTIDHGDWLAVGNSINALVKHYWEAVGIRVEVVEHSPALSLTGRAVQDTADVVQRPILGSEFHEWASEVGGTMHLVDTFGPGVATVSTVHEMLNLAIKLRKSYFRDQEYTELSTNLYRLHSEELFAIGTVGLAPVLLVTKPTIHNLPDAMQPSARGPLDLDAFGPLWFGE